MCQRLDVHSLKYLVRQLAMGLEASQEPSEDVNLELQNSLKKS